MYALHRADAFEWPSHAEANSIHAVVTDPPFGVVEYSRRQLAKRRNGNGGIWRLPPSFDNVVRQPVPRFTALSDADRAAIRTFFADFADLLREVLVPGAHVFVATTRS